MRLFKALFGGDEAAGRYPERLVEAAIERAVDETDPRLRLLPGYRRHLRGPVMAAIDQVIAVEAALPAAVLARPDTFSQEPRLAALYASAQSMLESFGRTRELLDFQATSAGRGAGEIFALLLAERQMRNVLGVDLAGDQLRREVAQVAVNFAGHRLVEPAANAADARRQLRHRAFDHLMVLALARLNEVNAERVDLARERDLLLRRQAALTRGGCTLDAAEGGPADLAGVRAELDTLNAQLTALGQDAGVLKANLALVADTLNRSAEQLRVEPLTLHMDAMNIERPPGGAGARQVDCQELVNAQGRRLVALPVLIDPRTLPEREDFLTAAARYQY